MVVDQRLEAEAELQAVSSSRACALRYGLRIERYPYLDSPTMKVAACRATADSKVLAENVLLATARAISATSLSSSMIVRRR